MGWSAVRVQEALLGLSTIRTARFLLRPFERRDAAAFACSVRESAAADDPWLSWGSEAYSEQDARQWFRAAADSREAGASSEFGIFSAADGAFLGGVGLSRIDPQNRVASLGYWVRPTQRRRGVAYECAQALVGHAFAVLGLQRVEIVVAVGNDPSVGVARKMGAHLECVAQNRLRIRGRPAAAYIFALIPRPSEPQP